MRVCILTTSFPRYEGDFSGQFVYALARNLVKKGVEVSVVAPHDYETRGYEVMGGVEVHRFQYMFPRRLQRIAYHGGISSNIRKSLFARIQIPFFVLSQAYSLRKVMRKEKIDVINSHWIVPSGFIASVFRKHYGISHLMTVHAAGLFALKNIVFGRKIAKFIVNNTDKVITDGSYVRDTLEDFVGFHLNADTSAMGVSLKNFVVLEDKKALKEKLGIQSKNIILYVGRLTHKKGVEYLIDAMKAVAQVIDDVQLIIIGGGGLEKRLKERVGRLNMDKYICFMGSIDHDKIIDYYALSDLVVIPSIIDRYGETEGMPAVVLEAMASGKPLIASDVSGIPDIVRDEYNGFIIKPNDSEDLANKIIKAFRYEQMDEIRKNALKTAKKYGWGVISKRYVGAMEDVIKGHNGEISDSGENVVDNIR